VIDLSDHNLPAGLDRYATHTLLQGDITAADYDEQLLKQSNAYRAILGDAISASALDYGFTTIRDLETEGAGYADVDLKKAINNGIIPGPQDEGGYPRHGRDWGVPTVRIFPGCAGAAWRSDRGRRG